MTSPPEEQPNVSELISEAQGLVRSLAMKVHRSLPIPMDLDDLIAYGQLGLAEAAQKYDPAEGVRFTTFAYYRVRGAIYDGVSKMNWTSRARLRRARFREMADDVIQSDATATAEGDAESPSESDAEWLGRMTERLAIVYLASGDENSDAGGPLNDAPDRHEIPSKVVANREMQLTLRKLVDQLPADARRLISSIYFEGFSLTEAAERVGISKSWASRIHAKGLDQLAQSLRRSGND
ncbi:sigma-70 family RNA polymerase sigma factor [Roseiconus lacunae]|uniref:Sigma-70 family RNA polymerase sigma factor n=1 Tax=Roseiconus lacunae TaxID=2605694 RepID=A0ABT7PI23_9BACT|nr:sigma-70 family RNA polymerase sigma factor [Roseiconus lacunae]MCD0461327.1 sigma-70 family RNA polymerase sigma factor [Roseiconus lacunae]MDM4016154.1 sigma-70 family RNA polymerase sigma factor [Roseiconus lacunae]WRQ51512.1 sigma-70 family RNA polymerase sigma factor [Stieleria sp. HD01]